MPLAIAALSPVAGQQLNKLSYNEGGTALIPKCMTCAHDLLNQLESLHPDAFGWAMACCGEDAEAARDVLQDAYVKVALGKARFGEKSSLKTWWFGVIRFTARESQRRQSRWRDLFDSLTAHFLTASMPEAPDTSASANCVPDVLSAALRRLPLRQAEVLHLVFYQQLSLSEAAGVMRISLGSARQHYQRGKQRLRGEVEAAQRLNPTCHE